MLRLPRRVANPNGIPSFSPRVARHELPWENAPKKSPNPERVASIPQVRLVERDFVTFPQAPELVLKRQLAMVLLLARDVGAHFFDLGIADGEHAATALPCEIAELRRAGFDPER